LGGLVEDGPFEPPLAGYTFFGPPTPADGELYVVGEKEKEIRLIALDPATGSVRWERLIAHAQAGIDQDPVRRGWPAPVATAGGVLVCPTTVGWLVGVDRSSRSILWAYRYAPPQPGREPGEANPVAAPAALNSRWGPSAPILHRGRVFFTPSEEARLVCLDLYTGELVWQRGKGANLYVAGVAGDRLVTVGIGAVEGIDVSNGVVRWSVPIPEDAGRPSGRAVLAEDRLFLPVRGDSLWQIDVRTGELVAEKPLPPGGASLGNLVMHRGTLLSYSPEGLTAFEERTELARQVDERLKENPGDAAASLRRAELQHSDGESLAAAATLDGLDVAALPAGDAAKFRRLRWDVLSALVRSEDAAPEAADRHLSELAAFAATPEERLTVRRLQADRASAAGKTAEAARAYLDLLKDSDAAGVVPEDGGRRRVRLTAWLGGRFEDLWTAAEGDARKTLDERIGEALRSAETDRDRERLTQVFAFHPAAAEVVRKLAAADLAAGRFAEAEARLLRLVRSDHVAVPAAALLDLADAAERAGLAQDARYWIEQATRYEPETVLPDGTPLEDAIARRATGKETGHRPAAGGHWGDFRLVVVRSGGYMSTETALEIAPDGAELPFFRDRRLQLAAQQDRLMISGPGGAGLERFVALRSGVRTGRRPAVVADGHLLFVLHQGVVQAVSPVEGRVLWSAPGPDDPTGMFPGETSPTAMRPAAALAGTAGLLARSRRNGSMPAASASYVALHGRGGLSVLDAATGELRWTRDDLPRGATIVGTESVLYVVPREGSRRMALRAVDGRAVPLGQSGKWLPHAVGAVGDRLVTVVAEEPPFRLFDLPLGRRSVVSLRDPQTGDILWSRAYPSDALFDLTADGRLCILSPNGELVALDAATGRPSPLGRVPVEVLRGRSEAVLLTDAESTYLIVNTGRGPSFFASDMPAVPASGQIFAFERDSGELRWRRDVSNRRLLCQDFDHMPVLLLTDSERTQKGGQGLWQVDLLALDKRTGEPVLDEPYYTNSTPFFRGLTVQPERRSIELAAYHTRLRLQAVPATAADAPADPGASGGTPRR
ncbi:MAG TPA: PQQ-binding-like beta-propeller repeat protein, partial [Planctomycetaceae bacterium]